MCEHEGAVALKASGSMASRGGRPLPRRRWCCSCEGAPGDGGGSSAALGRGPRARLRQARARRDSRFKGGLVVAVVRERERPQERFAGPLHVRAGDRIRIEVSTDHDGPLTAGLLTDEGEWVSSSRPGCSRRAPTTRSWRRASTILADARDALVGDPADVERARAPRDFDRCRRVAGNERGRSMRPWIVAAWLLATCSSLSAAARADPVRILVAVSHARGGDDELPLRHATEDADTCATSSRRRRCAARARHAPGRPFGRAAPVGRSSAREPSRFNYAPADVTFLLYFSGHGDRDGIHLGASDRVGRARRARAGRARRASHLVTDACRNDPTRPKGIAPSRRSPFGAAVTRPTVWCGSRRPRRARPRRSPTNCSGALFTHYWVNGLRGAADANGDGRVTLAESYDFAYSQTLFRSARGQRRPPAPERRPSTLDEYSPIVITQTFGGATKIESPAERRRSIPRLRSGVARRTGRGLGHVRTHASRLPCRRAVRRRASRRGRRHFGRGGRAARGEDRALGRRRLPCRARGADGGQGRRGGGARG